MLATVRSWIAALRRGRARPEPVELDPAPRLATPAHDRRAGRHHHGSAALDHPRAHPGG
ncbi:MAG: hypothetical protein U0531_19580 [Dehalococcoidia bacterium]